MRKLNKDRTFCVNIECESRNKCDRYFYNYKFEDEDVISVCCFGKYNEECGLFNEVDK